MIREQPDSRFQPTTFHQKQLLQLTLQLLGRAWQYAVDAKMDRWQFAIDIAEFAQAGVTKSELRWLVAHKYVLTAIEVTHPSHTQRQFSVLHNTSLPENTCLILSELGLRALAKLSSKPSKANRAHIQVIHTQNGHLPSKHEGNHVAPSTPYWDPYQKILSLGKSIVKRFRRPAPNQELIITAFQESEWSTRIDDPLPVVTEQDPLRRLNETIKSLNGCQINKLICFRGDGSGTGILWEMHAPNSL